MHKKTVTLIINKLFSVIKMAFCIHSLGSEVTLGIYIRKLKLAMKNVCKWSNVPLLRNNLNILRRQTW